MNSEVDVLADPARLRRLRMTVAAVVAGLVVIGVTTPGPEVPQAVTWSLVGVAVLIAAGALARTVVRVTTTGSEVVLRRYLGTTVLPRPRVEAAITVGLYERPFSVPSALLLLLDNKGKVAARLTGHTFAAEDLVRIAEASSGAVTSLDFGNPGLLSRHAPRALGFAERRPLAHVLVITFGLLAALLLAGVVYAVLETMG